MKRQGIIRVETLGESSIQFTKDIDIRIASFKKNTNNGHILFAPDRYKIEEILEVPESLSYESIVALKRIYYYYYKVKGFKMMNPFPPEANENEFKEQVQFNIYERPVRGTKVNKAINQYDLQGNFIRKWENAAQIRKETGITTSHIYSVCRGKTRKAKGYVWKFKD